MVAETNRTPFDLPEAEAELVAGYNIEYSSIVFSLFFLAEYSNMILMSFIVALLYFWGGCMLPAGITLIDNAEVFSHLSIFILPAKAFCFCFLFILIRATLSRYRYDQLMDIG
jgi:NADH-quinone oxidoreductase subunit H